MMLVLSFWTKDLDVKRTPSLPRRRTLNVDVGLREMHEIKYPPGNRSSGKF